MRNGSQFTVSFPGLPAGTYTVVVEGSEIYFAQAGSKSWTKMERVYFDR